MATKRNRFTRRDVLKYGAMSGAAMVGTRALGQVCVDQTPVEIDTVAFTGCSAGGEKFPISPFILRPFEQELPVPTALRTGWRQRVPGGTEPDWTVRKSVQFGPGVVLPGPGKGQQDALGDRPGNHALAHPQWGIPNAGTHQLWTSGPGVTGRDLGLPDPLLYHIRLQVRAHKHTTSPVVNIDSGGNVVALPPGVNPTPAGLVTFRGQQVPSYFLPPSTIYGFNGTFPGPLINVEYGRPVLVRFENDLDLNPLCRDRQDFGAPDWAFLTHLHNGHTAPESDGQPHHLIDHEGGYQPMEWSDNLYLNYPAGGDDREKQSFLWFHDHRMHHTGPNVYKGMVGLAPHYDPVLDNGDETRGLRLPGVRTNNPDGTFDVQYDIPMAFYDCILDDGVTEHKDEHTALAVCGDVHPEWWGQLFHKHHPNHGFVGDIFTVNGVAFPTLHVERRKYRFRWLGASLSRIYDLSFRTGTPVPVPGMQGQWNFGTVDSRGRVTRNAGTQALRMTQIASEGGLLPTPIIRDSIEIWPAKRREVIVDFTPFSKGDVMYLTNTLPMEDGRKPTTNDPLFAVPVVKIVIGDPPAVADQSLMPIAGATPLRAAPPFDPNAAPVRTFNLERSGAFGPEAQWVINGLQFDPLNPQATPILDSAEAWGINDNGGGWTHPMHIHMEEHHVILRNGQPTPEPRHPDDTGKEDVVALDPGEETVIFRRFRTFLGNYVAHCHNLAHEDHNMMFGWSIVRTP